MSPSVSPPDRPTVDSDSQRERIPNLPLSPDPPPPPVAFSTANRDSFIARSIRTLLCALVCGSSKLHSKFNDIRIYGNHSYYLECTNPDTDGSLDTTSDANSRSSSSSSSSLFPRRVGRIPLLTVSNHVSTIDDPYVLSCITPFSTLSLPSTCRWGWCAQEICFPNPFISSLFRYGKIFPIVRGGSLYQPGMMEAQRHLYDSDWLHVFPEGRCWPDAGLQAFRWGIGKLIATSSIQFHQPPIVIPIVHRGMERVMPINPPFRSIWQYYILDRLPRIGQTVRVLIGEPVEYQDLIQRHQQLVERNQVWREEMRICGDERLYEAITNRVRERLVEMEKKLEEIEKQEMDSSQLVIPTSSSGDR